MQPSVFSKKFRFHTLVYREYHYNDARGGNDCHYIGYMRQGSGRIVWDGGEMLIGEGELFYIPMGFRYESHWSGIPEVFFDSYGFTYFPHPATDSYPLQKIPVTPTVLERLNALAENKNESCLSLACFYFLLDAILPLMHTGHSCSKQVTVEEAIAYMQNAKRLSVPDLARHCRVSESGIYAAFRVVKGCTPIETWHRIQIERAVDMLLSTDLSIEEICEKLGFCSASYFRKILRAYTGKTPREIRKSVGV